MAPGQIFNQSDIKGASPWLVSCSTSKPTVTNNSSGASDFEKLTDDLIYGSLALSPVNATQAGYHEHNGVPLDGLLDDYSTSGIDTKVGRSTRKN